MERDLERLRRVAALFDADIKRALGGSWQVTVAPGPILLVSDGQRTEQVMFDGDVDLDAWPDDAWTEEYREYTLDDDASEALGSELLEVMDLWDEPFPSCPEHGTTLIDVCSMTWTCPGPPSHDLALVGRLGE